MEQNFVRQNGFLKIFTIAVTANFYAQECCAYDRRAVHWTCVISRSLYVCLLIDYLHTQVDWGLPVCRNGLVFCCRDPSLLVLCYYR